MTLQPSSRSVVSVPLLLTTGVAVNVQRFRCYLVPRCHGDLTGVDINLTAGVYTPKTQEQQTMPLSAISAQIFTQEPRLEKAYWTFILSLHSDTILCMCSLLNGFKSMC